jgi:hypothetical protein
VRYTTPSRRPDDADGQAILARFKGRRLPMVDEVQVSIIEENQPLWLSLPQRRDRRAGGQCAARCRWNSRQAAPNGKLAPNLAKRGVQLHRNLRSDTALAVLQHGRPGRRRLHAEKVALRRASRLAYDVSARSGWCAAARPCRRSRR